MTRMTKAEKKRIEKFMSTASRFCAFYPDLKLDAYVPGYFFGVYKDDLDLDPCGILELPEWFVERTVDLLEAKK